MNSIYSVLTSKNRGRTDERRAKIKIETCSQKHIKSYQYLPIAVHLSQSYTEEENGQEKDLPCSPCLKFLQQ